MKFVKVLIILSGFLVVLSAVVNIYYLTQANSPILGIYIELCTLVVLFITIIIIYNIERKQKE